MVRLKSKITFYLIVLPYLLCLQSCGGCSKSGLYEKSKRNSKTSFQINDYPKNTQQGKTIVKMENNYGVKYIWVEINGIRLKFIFDTGASSICISTAEANVLYLQGTLKKEDILDVQYFQNATGEISAGTRINLRTVKIGNRVLQNIEAVVIDNYNAPLLLGQSALEKFGKISIDNKNDVITFE